MNDVNKIEKLLSDEKYLNKYIDNISNKQIEIPADLKENISSKIYRKKKKFYLDICKIAACLIFSLAICQSDFITNDKLGEYTKKEIKQENTYVKEKISDICDIFTKPIDKGGKEK